MRKVMAVIIVLALVSCAGAEMIQLPAPAKTGGMSLNEAVTLRRSTREFADTALTEQELSDLLYVTAGVNRDNGLRVYPVAMGRQDTTVYVFTRDGVCRYDAPTHSLELIATGDHRQDTGMQPFVGQAAVNLAYVHDMRMWEGNRPPKEEAAKWGFAHTGAAMQNAYLFAASKGWNAVIRGSFDSKKLSSLMKLAEGQTITLIQSIGPKP